VATGTDPDGHAHYTDTGGATDHVFALCHLLGYRFVPRIRDLRDRRLGTIGRASGYPALAPILGRPIRTDVIRESWDELIRLAASIQARATPPSAMLKKLAAYKRQNRLDLALGELGRLERTFFTLDWLESPELRRRCHAGLNKSEARHALARAVFAHKQGRIADRTVEGQEHRASGLNLVIAAIACWNTIYLDRAVDRLRGRGEACRSTCCRTSRRWVGATSRSPATTCVTARPSIPSGSGRSTTHQAASRPWPDRGSRPV
jgi:TnpA family transposase